MAPKGRWTYGENTARRGHRASQGGRRVLRAKCLLLHDLLEDVHFGDQSWSTAAFGPFGLAPQLAASLAQGLQLWHCTEGSGKQSLLHPWAAFLSTEEAI